MQKFVLIVGYGKMGRIHAKHLQERGVVFRWHDPYIYDEFFPFPLDKFSHIIIASPTESHVDCYRQIGSGFSGRILIEKPIALQIEDVEKMSQDPRVFPGLSERYNSAAKLAVDLSDGVVDCEFIRSHSSSFVDTAIHDLDIFLRIAGNIDPLIHSIESHGNTVSARILSGNTDGRFLWTTYQIGRTLKTVTKNGRIFHFDLQSQAINGIPLQQRWTIDDELGDFLDGVEPESYLDAHRLLIRCIKNLA